MKKKPKDLAITVLAKRVQGMDDYNLGILTQICLFETAVRFPKNFMNMTKDAIDNVLKNRHLTDDQLITRIEDMLK